MRFPLTNNPLHDLPSRPTITPATARLPPLISAVTPLTTSLDRYRFRIPFIIPRSLPCDRLSNSHRSTSSQTSSIITNASGTRNHPRRIIHPGHHTAPTRRLSPSAPSSPLRRTIIHRRGRRSITNRSRGFHRILIVLPISNLPPLLFPARRSRSSSSNNNASTSKDIETPRVPFSLILRTDQRQRIILDTRKPPTELLRRTPIQPKKVVSSRRTIQAQQRRRRAGCRFRSSSEIRSGSGNDRGRRNCRGRGSSR